MNDHLGERIADALETLVILLSGDLSHGDLGRLANTLDMMSVMLQDAMHEDREWKAALAQTREVPPS